MGIDHSAALAEANRQLHALRAAHGVRPSAETRSAANLLPVSDGEPGSIADQIAALPSHLGWGSVAVSAVVRAARTQQEARQARRQPLALSADDDQQPAPPPTLITHKDPARRGHVKLYPSLALALLREKQTAAGRLWLLLRHLDSSGCGSIRITTARHHFCDKHAPLRFCGWRQLRNLLRQGDGLFWQRDADRVWLRSVAKVAASLAVEKLHGWPVALPVPLLTQSIGTVRAHFYASFHAGRQRDAANSMPIARETLEGLSGVDRRSQRLYERRIGLAVHSNIAIGERASAEAAHERGWQLGRALFHFVDVAGNQGRAGETYLAWQLPNSYGQCHTLCPRGRQKRINRELTDLFVKGMTGNGQQAIERRYFATGRQAALHKGETAYWHRETTRQSGIIWTAA